MLMSPLRSFIKNIFSDAMLIACVFAPVLAGFAFRFGIPVLESLLIKYFGHPVIGPYYALVDLFLGVLAPMMVCFASAMAILDERDCGVCAYLMVTPVGRSGYIATRLGLPALASSVYSIAILAIFGLSGLPSYAVALTAFGMGLTSFAMTLAITVLSANRIEGLAVGKLSGLALMGVVVPFFARGNERFFAGFLPSFWIAEAVLRPTLLSIAGFLLVCALWCGLLYPRFMSRARGR